VTLEDWLKQDRSLADQLKVVEGLCSALNEGHQRGALHRGLAPATIEVASDGSCDLSDAISATSSSSRYRAPELGEGAAHSAQSDIYSAGVIFYEMLSGRSPSPDRPTALADLRPDVPRDLTDAIMGCLEKGPDWRPKDLSYLLQVVGTLRGQGAGKGVRTPARQTEAPRAARATSAARRPAKTGSSASLPMIAVVLVLAGGAAGAWFWLKGGATSPAGPKTAAVRPSVPTTVATTLPTEAPAATRTPGPSTKPAAPPAGASPSSQPVATPPPTPTPPPVTQVARATPPSVATPAPTPPPTPTPAPTPEAAAPAPDVVAAANEPTVLTAVSPLQLKRGATTILDVRGSGLRSDQRATVLKIKEAPNGISVVRQKFVNGGLVQVIVKLEPTAAPGAYGLALADTAGTFSNTLSFTVAK
jgi:serine/threonine protein kinase